MAKFIKRKVKISSTNSVDSKKLAKLQAENDRLHELNDELILSLKKDDEDLKEFRSTIKRQGEQILKAALMENVFYINGQKFGAPVNTTSCFHFNDAESVFLCHAVFEGLCDPKTTEQDPLYVDTYKFDSQSGSYTLIYHTDGSEE